jgi:ABC-type dipeptide/oligopeptide/nickel transport system permease component
LPALWLVLTLVFLLIHLVPGDPVEQMLGEGAAPAQVEKLRHALGLGLLLDVQLTIILATRARRFRAIFQISSARAPRHLL